MSYAGRLGLSHQEFFSLDPIANLAFAKMTLATSHSTFVSTRQVCTAIMAVIPLTRKIQSVCRDFDTTAKKKKIQKKNTKCVQRF